MEKISGILPSRPNITKVDTKGALPLRPGAPNFGQEEGRSPTPLKDRVSLSSDVGPQVYQENMSYRKMKDLQQAKLVGDLTKKFFAQDPVVATRSEDKKLGAEQDAADMVSTKKSQDDEVQIQTVSEN